MTPPRRTPIWSTIAQSLRADIAASVYSPGDRLPTESTLASRFGVNRHTVRHAFRALADEGLVLSRRGAGVFVKSIPTDYPIGRRVRFHQNLSAQGRIPSKELLLLETRAPRDEEFSALGLADGTKVQVCEGLSFADGQVVAVFRSVFSAARFPDILDHLAQTQSVTAALRLGGVTDYTRASTRINAKLANATQALHLRVAEHAPILRTISLNVDSNGTPLEYGRTWFAGDKVTLTLSDG